MQTKNNVVSGRLLWQAAVAATLGASAHITQLWLMSAVSHISNNAQSTPITTPTRCMIHTLPIHDSIKADALKSCSVHITTTSTGQKSLSQLIFFKFYHAPLYGMPSFL